MRPAQLVQGRYPMVAEGFLHVRSFQVLEFKLNSNLTPFIMSTNFRLELSGSCPDCLVPVQCFLVCFVSEHMALSLFAMSSPCPTSLFPLVTPPCLFLVRLIVSILVCSAALYCVPFPCVFAGSFWCSWS